MGGVSAHGPVQFDFEPALGQVLHAVTTPLNHCYRSVHGVLEVDIVHFGSRIQSVGVHVNQVRAARTRTFGKVGVDPDQHESGGNDPWTHAQSLAQPLGEGGLARPQFTGQYQQIPGLKHPAERCSERVGLFRRRDLDPAFPLRSGHSAAAFDVPLAAAAASVPVSSAPGASLT